MIVNEMFKKNINRNIKGVIKVGQQDAYELKQELEEYVVTNEIQGHLNKFYNSYNVSLDEKTDKMGVWISGFFGSGKSHFLKILSCLLENRKINDIPALEYFKDKIDNPMLYGEMKRASNVETEAILFNIDSQSDALGKDKDDSILNVFKKVFNINRGFSEDFGVAQLEIKLSEEGLYDAFQEQFYLIRKKTWLERRNSCRFEKNKVIQAIQNSTDMDQEAASEFYYNCMNNYAQSINDFSNEVKSYLSSKSTNSHLVFLVDEVGQYIGNDSKLMVNLQTLTEDLGSACNGKVWVIVTSQEGIDELSKDIKGDDFSKIQGRFDTRLSLSSLSANEVIKKRILEKTVPVQETLELMYLDESVNLNNLITFKNASGDFSSYSDASDYSSCYPFVSYQFKLLQKVFEEIRKHGSSGKHLSEGARSLLSAFQESAIAIEKQEKGVLAPFHLFFNTVEEFLNPSINRVFANAKENTNLKNDIFSINVLKVLFMLKYIKEMEANIENIATLMVSDIHEDKLNLKEKILESLKKLIKETLIQKNGEIYIFLTDNEQEINKEIKDTKVSIDAVKLEMQKTIFGDLYDKKKFRYSINYDFDVNKKMDEKLYGSQTSSLGLNILSPLSENYEKADSSIAALSMHDDKYIVIKLANESKYTDEVEEYLRISTYIQNKPIANVDESIKTIISGKNSELHERQKRARIFIESALLDADYYIQGEKIVTVGSNVKDKISSALNNQVERNYHKLSYITTFLSKPSDVDSIINSSFKQGDLIEDSEDNLLAKQELVKDINNADFMNKQIICKAIMEKYSAAPYGWKELDIAGILGELLKNQFIKIKYKGKDIKEFSNKIGEQLLRTSDMNSIVIEKRKVIDSEFLNNVVKNCKSLWNQFNVPTDEDSLKNYILDKISNIKESINEYKAKYTKKYPGEEILDKGLFICRNFSSLRDNSDVFNMFNTQYDNLFEFDEQFEIVQNFFSNQVKMFDKAKAICERYESNKLYINDDNCEKVYNSLKAIINNPNPYSDIQNIPVAVNKLDSEIKDRLEVKRTELDDTINERINHLEIVSKDKDVAKFYLNEAIGEFKTLKDKASNTSTILNIEGLLRVCDSITQSYDLKICEVIEKQQIDDGSIGKVEPIEDVVKKEPHIKRVLLSNLTDILSVSSSYEITKLVNKLSEKLNEELSNCDKVEFIK